MKEEKLQKRMIKIPIVVFVVVGIIGCLIAGHVFKQYNTANSALYESAEMTTETEGNALASTVNSIGFNPSTYVKPGSNIIITVNDIQIHSNIIGTAYYSWGTENYANSLEVYEKNNLAGFVSYVVTVPSITGNSEEKVLYFKYNDEKREQTYQIDAQTPTINYCYKSTESWTNKDVEITVHAIDNFQDKLSYSFDGGKTWQVSNVKAYTENTENIIMKVKDAAGNISSDDVTANITNIDKTKPTPAKIKITIGDGTPIPALAEMYTNQSVTWELNDNGSDAESGIDFSNYSVQRYQDNTYMYTLVNDYEKKFSLNDEGKYRIQAKTKDVAGNFAFREYYVYIDKTNPDLQLSNSEKKVTATASDRISGLADKPYSFDGGKNWQSESEYTYTSYGTKTVQVKDKAGNITTKTITLYDPNATVPTCTITASEESPTNASSITYTFTFSGNVTGFTIDDVTVTNGTKGDFTAVSGKEYTLIVTNSESCTQEVSITSGVCANPANISIEIDRVRPTCTITATVDGKTIEGLTNASSITYIFTFSEDVIGFDASDITVENGTKGKFTKVSDSEYTLVVTNEGSCIQKVGMEENKATDAAGNGNTDPVNISIEIDRVRPTCTITASEESPTNASSITYTFTFSEDVIGFDASDITVENGTKGEFTKVSDSEYTLVVTNEGSCIQKVGMVENKATDAAGNGNTNPANISIEIDRVRPTCTITASEESPTNVNSITYTFTFSENVIGFDASDITVQNGTKGEFTKVSDSEYTLVVTNEGSCIQKVGMEENKATDAAGNGNTDPVNISIEIDRTRPICTITATVDGKTIEGSTNASSITYTFIFSEDVTGFDASDIAVEKGTKGTFTKVSDSEYTLVVTNEGNEEFEQIISILEGSCNDIVGNQNEEYSHSVIIDRVAPTVIATSKLGGPDGIDYKYGGTWTEENVYLKLESKDDGAGLESTVYKVWNLKQNSKEVTEYEGNTFEQTFTNIGRYLVEVKAKDKAGNEVEAGYLINIGKAIRIEVNAELVKTEYSPYDNFDKAGMKVEVVYEFENTEYREETEEYTVLNGENLTCNVKKIYIGYNKNTELTATVDINVEHSFTEYKSDNNATCTEDGTKTAKCENCNETDTKEDEGSKLGHSFINYISDNNATCTEDGTETAKCERCNETDTKEDEGSKLGHSFTNYVSDNNATCTEDGTKTAKCENCNETDTKEDEGSKLGHNFTNYVSDNNATCTEDGTKTAKCERCNETDTKEDEGSKLGHSFINYVSDNNATCTEDGTKTAKCERCNETDTKIDEGSKREHIYEDGECKNCGVKETKLTVTSEKYTIKNTYISKIQSKTTVNKLIENIQTNATEIKVYNAKGELQGNTTTIATGMQIEFKFGSQTQKFTIAVSGDANGDGNANFTDMLLINRHRLRKITLAEEKFLAADVTADGKLDFIDLIKINRFRLKKITEL